MQTLLDTHALIWFINGEKSLPENVKNSIADIDNKCLISIASIWEMAIKLSLKKLKLKSNFNQIANLLIENDIQILPISFEHIQQLLKLEYHHRDPFDRIIIAQSICDDLTIFTKDKNFKLYPVKIKWN